MNKKSLTLLVLMLITAMTFGQIHKMAPKVVMIGIGEKNLTLDESRYPNLKFYYTPGLVSQAKAGKAVKTLAALSGSAKETYAGEPEFVAEMWNEKDLEGAFMLFDKNGLCVTQGYKILQQGGDIGGRLCADRDPLKDHLKKYVKKEKTGKATKKKMKMKKSDFMIGREMPEFNISSIKEKNVSVNEVLKSGVPTLVVFFHLSKDLDIEEAKKSDQSDKTGKGLLSTMAEGAAGAKVTDVFKNLESQLFRNDIRE